eukprot:SAG25_NODE_10647_length_326_cov_2.026432_1_plen_29_part_01
MNDLRGGAIGSVYDPEVLCVPQFADGDLC